MEPKPNHYDGSVQLEFDVNNETDSNDTVQITDEMRTNIGGNPYLFDNK